ncbi:MAG: efflux RND transporter permease subunit [Pseudomonadota bacterium]
MKTLLFDNPRALLLVTTLIIVGGLAAFFTMPQTEDPRVTNRVATILTPLPGASAELVERLVTQPIEESLQSISDIEDILSSSRTGLSSITLYLREDIVETAEPFSRIRDAIADARTELPSTAGDSQFIDDRNEDAYSVLTALIWDATSEPNLIILKRTAEELRSRLRNFPGTDYVGIHGASPEEIAVTLPNDIAQALGLSEREIAQSIASADVKGAAGQFFGDSAQYTLEVEGEIDSLDRLRKVPLQVGGNGATVQLGDIADIERSPKDPLVELALIDGRPAVVVGARMEPGLRIESWANALVEELHDFEKTLSAGIEQRIIFNQADYASVRFSSLLQNLFIGISLVVAILFFTLGVKSAILVMFAIPLTSLLALTLMNFSGIPIHQMSITGLIVALGLMVDAAIVVCDAVTRRLQSGLSPREAVKQSVERLWLPLLSSTLTTVFAFLPISLLPGAAGEFVGGISDSVIIALLSSYLLAMTVIVGFAGWFFGTSSRHTLSQGFSFPIVAVPFQKILDWSLRLPIVSILLALILPVLGFIGVTTLPSQFFPEADRNQFHVEIRLSPQSSLLATKKAAEIADEILEADERIVSAEWFVGNSVPSFYYNLSMDQDGAKDFAEAMVTTRSLEGIKVLQNEMQDTLSKALPNAQVLVRALAQGPPTEAPVELRIFGRDLTTLQRLGEEARGILAQLPDVTVTFASISGGEPKLWLVADEDDALNAGLTLAQVADGLTAKLQGAQGGTIVEAEEEIDVVVRLDEKARRDITEIESLSISNPALVDNLSRPANGVAATPITGLGELALRPSAAVITRYDGQRVNTVTAYIRSDALASNVVAAFKAKAEEFTMPAGYRYEFGGDAEARSDAVGNLLASVGLIVVATIAVVVLSFNSFRLSVIVFLVAGLSMGLGMFSLTLFNYPFGFQPIIALMGLMGVAINAAIIILSGLQGDKGAMQNDKLAVRNVVVETSRHITSTTLTTFMGFLPLILSGGGFWPPFATAIAGGVVLSTIISFFFVPQMFLLFNRPKHKLSATDKNASNTPLMTAT